MWLKSEEGRLALNSKFLAAELNHDSFWLYKSIELKSIQHAAVYEQTILFSCHLTIINCQCKAALAHNFARLDRVAASQHAGMRGQTVA